MKRLEYKTRNVRLIGEQQRANAVAILVGAPLDSAKPLEFILREEVKARKPDQNALMWAGPLKDLAEQAVIEGQRFSAEAWHHYLKEQFLPEEFDPLMCKEGYLKWEYTPDEKRILRGSTKDLTIKGFALYLEQVYAFGGNLGVEFQVNPNQSRRAA